MKTKYPDTKTLLHDRHIYNTLKDITFRRLDIENQTGIMVQQGLGSMNCGLQSDYSSENGDDSSLFDTIKDGDQPDMCAFCLDRIQNPEKLHCNHAFCKSCLALYREARNWVAKRCPICRSSLDMDGQVSRQFHDVSAPWVTFRSTIK